MSITEKISDEIKEYIKTNHSYPRKITISQVDLLLLNFEMIASGAPIPYSSLFRKPNPGELVGKIYGVNLFMEGEATDEHSQAL